MTGLLALLSQATDGRGIRGVQRMAKIVVFGGTGYTGANIVREAASRGHGVISVSRSKPEDGVDGVQYEVGGAEDVATRVIPGADAVVAALSPRGDIAEEYRDEALEGEATRVLLEEGAPEDLDWVFVSPAATYGAYAPGQPTRTYRASGDVALFDGEGGSNISGADFALAVVDEIETAGHHREHIGIAY
jgi:putative NADH-flavin reductase